MAPVQVTVSLCISYIPILGLIGLIWFNKMTIYLRSLGPWRSMNSKWRPMLKREVTRLVINSLRGHSDIAQGIDSWVTNLQIWVWIRFLHLFVGSLIRQSPFAHVWHVWPAPMLHQRTRSLYTNYYRPGLVKALRDSSQRSPYVSQG